MPSVPIASSAPTRIDLAGGTIDIWPLYLFHDGATTLNAAISSARSCTDRQPRPDGCIELHLDRHRTSCPRPQLVRAWRIAAKCRSWQPAARHYRIESATLTTRGESPAGAGIAGSSALTIAACGALAAMDRTRRDPEATSCRSRMNVEVSGPSRCRPACRITGPRCTAESPRSSSGADGVGRVALDVDSAPSSSVASSWPTPERHAIPGRTTGKSRSAISTAIARCSTASSASGTRPPRCVRALERADWDEVGRQIANEWDQPKAARPGVTTPTIDRADRTRAAKAGATAAKVCGAGGGGCLFCYGPTACAIGGRSRRRRAARACSTCRIEQRRAQRWIIRPIARILRRDRRSSGNQGRESIQDPRISKRAPTSSPITRITWPAWTPRALREIPGIGKDLAARIREIARQRRVATYHRELVAEFPPTVFDLLHLQGVGPKTVCDALPRTRHRDTRRAARSGHLTAAIRGYSRHGPQEGSAHSQGARGAQPSPGPPSPA